MYAFNSEALRPAIGKALYLLSFGIIIWYQTSFSIRFNVSDVAHLVLEKDIE
ncbi:MAG: hypothetical protein WCZ90_04320 [Melioribacteraceae bacterium]